jgi:hypothetical protein
MLSTRTVDRECEEEKMMQTDKSVAEVDRDTKESRQREDVGPQPVTTNVVKKRTNEAVEPVVCEETQTEGEGERTRDSVSNEIGGYG